MSAGPRLEAARLYAVANEGDEGGSEIADAVSQRGASAAQASAFGDDEERQHAGSERNRIEQRRHSRIDHDEVVDGEPGHTQPRGRGDADDHALDPVLARALGLSDRGEPYQNERDRVEGAREALVHLRGETARRLLVAAAPWLGTD